MKALDLFCCAGGATLGLQQAGFEVTGVDMDARNRDVYPGHFIHADVQEVTPDFLAEFDLVWASPPCQAFSTMRHGPGEPRKPGVNLIPFTRELLAGHPNTCIENVPPAPIRADLTLTAPTFGLMRIERKRIFELSKPIDQPVLQHMPKGTMARGEGIVVTTSLAAPGHYYPRRKAGLPGRVPAEEACEAMGIDLPLNAHQVGEAIPPAYARYIGERLLAAKPLPTLF